MRPWNVDNLLIKSSQRLFMFVRTNWPNSDMAAVYIIMYAHTPVEERP